MVVLILALLLGVNPGDLLGTDAQPGSEPGTSQVPASPFAQCTRGSGSDVATDRNCRFVAYTNSIQDYWGGVVPDYQVIKVTTFTGQMSTACGTATAEVGPFSCSGDTSVYLDPGFFDELTTKLGAKGGDAAEAYVLAHEFGHHVQDLEGTLRRVHGGSGGSGPTSPGVRLELQADCSAGVWFNHATNDPGSPISEVTQADLDDALDAAAAVGDDRIQKEMQGQVAPETWTHGSAANRQKWLTTGFTQGDPAACDRFGRGVVS